ncbi:hypothetical protein AQUCO_01400230v1 [Aquilegia coerulea]|uniref:Uncharacterized protein n=1 Tax=Aquilegia coerulea TaxID=218851 RepID=A0A2G5DVF3_AQUCA|nr:hypothetical protein AQUCO_01400230v1 [Aquilegia coerulea]
MKNKKKSRSSMPANSSGAPPQPPPPPPPYHFIPPPPIPFYHPPPPPWSGYPGVWQIPPPGPPPPGFAMTLPPPLPVSSSQNATSGAAPASSSGAPIAYPPPFGLWPHPGVFTSPPMVMCPIMPPMPPTSSVQGSVMVPTTTQNSGMPSVSGQTPTVIEPSENHGQPPPPLRKGPITRRSIARECAVDSAPEAPKRESGSARQTKSKKHNDVKQKNSPDQHRPEPDVFHDQKSLRQDASTVEGEENNAPLPKLGSEPVIGLGFASEDEAYEFYNAYAKEKGFSIRKSHIQRSRVDRSVISREYVCANQGFRSANDRRYKGKIVRPRRETRVDCRAVLSIKRRSGKWVVDRFHKEHNHGLVDPVKAEKLRSHRKITSTTKSVIDTLYKCRIGPSKIIDVLAKAAAQEDKIEISGLDLIKYMKKEQKNNIEVDCYRVLEYFQGIQALDPGFFYAIEVGENRSMRSIFWADSRARAAYNQFGDVMVFDTICRTNKDLFPFASFTGVNHHRQAVLFGCAFLADETVESFIWLFETFLRAMSHKHPVSLITNRDKAMMVAIEKVLPKTRQRSCMLHIEKSLLDSMSSIFDMHPDFQAGYRKCINGSRNPEEFELDWKKLLVKYSLKDNNWLIGMYDLRKHWVPLYLQDTFFAGMTTTQLGDGMDYFDGFLHDKTTLDEFIPQYELAVKQRRDEEADEDFMTMYTSAGSTSKNPLEEQAARVFTRNMFTMFSHEFYESSGCILRKIDEEKTMSKYLVGKIGDEDDEMSVVIFDLLDNNASCSCHMFELEGMLCRHMLKVFQEINVVEIPTKYILKRWTMNARYVGSCNNGAGDSLQSSPLANVWTLKSAAIKFVELGAASTERLNCAFTIIEEGMEKLSLTCAPQSDSPPENVGCDSSQGEKADDTTLHVYDTTSPVETRDRPTPSKIRLGIKLTQKKKRKCSTCKQTGHYTNTCPQGSVIQSETSTNVAGSS